MTYKIAVAVFSLGLLFTPANAQEKTKEKIGDVRALYDGKLFPDVQVNTFRHIDQLFPSRKIARGKSVYPLPRSSSPLTDLEFTSGNRKHDLAEFLSLNRVAGLLVIKDGKSLWKIMSSATRRSPAGFPGRLSSPSVPHWLRRR
jgi:hypothetical protein